MEVLRQLEVSEATFNRWRATYGGMKAEEAKRLKQMETENQRLKKLVAEQALDIDMLKELAEGKFSVTVRGESQTAARVAASSDMCVTVGLAISRSTTRASLTRSLWPTMRRNWRSASIIPAAVQRRHISPDCQRLTLREERLTHSIIDSIGFVDAACA